MKKRYGAFLATSAMLLGGLMMPAAAYAGESADEEVCGYTETQYTRVMHHEAVTHEESQYAREYTETRYEQIQHHEAVYEDVLYIEWRARGNLSGFWYGNPVFLPEGETPSGSAGPRRSWQMTGETDLREELVTDAFDEVIDEQWAEESPGEDWRNTEETRNQTEYRWGTESPGEDWTATGVTRTVEDEPAYHDAPEYVWAEESPGEEWSETGETRFVEEECPAAPAADVDTDVEPVAVVGALPNTGGPSAMIGIIAALVIGAGGLLLTAARKFGNA